MRAVLHEGVFYNVTGVGASVTLNGVGVAGVRVDGVEAGAGTNVTGGGKSVTLRGRGGAVREGGGAGYACGAGRSARPRTHAVPLWICLLWIRLVSGYFVKMKYCQAPCVVEFTVSPEVPFTYEARTRIRKPVSWVPFSVTMDFPAVPSLKYCEPASYHLPW